MSPQVSIIVRSIARPTLNDALASIAIQDYPNIEVVTIGASGPSHPTPPDFAGPHPLRFVPGGLSLSRPAAANAGLDAARGEWITFLDDDDVFLAGHIGGMVAAQRDARDARVVHSLARVRFADGGTELFGHPFSPLQLYERSYIHLSSALVSRGLLALGCRFDETLDMHEDWDFFLQCAQHGGFHFVPLQTFEWRADLGTSGAGAGANQDDARFAMYRDRVYAKWRGQREALIDRVAPILHEAAARAGRGDFAGAQSRASDALAVSANDPWALNLIALIQRSTGRLAEADATQTLAVAVRPDDAALVYNLGLISRARGNLDRARSCAQRALHIAPGHAAASRLLSELDGFR
ncbi:MAG: glycosyltransferase [Casimicrobiaceae bacterium]